MRIVYTGQILAASKRGRQVVTTAPPMASGGNVAKDFRGIARTLPKKRGHQVGGYWASATSVQSFLEGYKKDFENSR